MFMPNCRRRISLNQLRQGRQIATEQLDRLQQHEENFRVAKEIKVEDEVNIARGS